MGIRASQGTFSSCHDQDSPHDSLNRAGTRKFVVLLFD